MLTLELEKIISDTTGQPTDASDPRLLDAARELRGLPVRLACDPVVAIMTLIDGWTRKTASAYRTLGSSGGFVETVRQSRPRAGRDREWLHRTFPELFERALELYEFLT